MIFSKKVAPPPLPDLSAYTNQGQQQNPNQEDASAARIQHLEQKVERLTALVETIWSILESKSSLNEKHLKARLSKIMELRDSRSAARNECPKCSQKNSAAKTQCIYCGAPLPKPGESEESAFNF